MALDTHAEETVVRAGRLTGWLLGFIVVFIILGLALSMLVGYGMVYAVPWRNLAGWLIPLMALLLLVELAFIICSVRLACTGESAYSRPAAVIGSAVLTASIWFDVLTTIATSPDLAREGNFFIVMSREFHVPIWGMYLLGFLAQLGITIISCSLWTSFVRHHRLYFQVIWAMQPKNLLQYLWVSLGGNLRSTRMLSQRGVFRRSYRIIWIIVLCLIQPFSRWIYGLEWIGVPVRRLLMNRFGMGVLFLEQTLMAIAALGFIVWLVYAYYFRKKHHQFLQIV